MNDPDSTTDGDLERLLERFSPVGPPAGLRQRVLAVARSAPAAHRPRRFAVSVWRAAVAAGFMAAVCLTLAADRISTRTAGQIGIGPAVWTQQEEEIAQMLDGDGCGRRYVAMALRAGPLGDRLVLASPETDAKTPY